MEIDTIVCGDCLDVMRDMPDGCVDLVVTSPPYDELRTYNGNYQYEFESVAIELSRIIKAGRHVIWIIGDETKNFCESLTSAKQKIFFVETCGLNLLDTMIYKKVGYPPAYPNLRRYANEFEYMLVLTKGKPDIFNPIRVMKAESTLYRQQYHHVARYRQQNGELKEGGSYSDKDDKQATNVWSYKTGGNYTNDEFALQHPAVFPEKLAEDHITSWSNLGDLIFDPFIGSGTTAVAALKLGRHFYGCDINEDYVRLANERIEKTRLKLSQVEMELA